MKCPECSSLDSHIIDSRASRDGETTRRRHRCDDCSHRYTTYENYEPDPRRASKAAEEEDDGEPSVLYWKGTPVAVVVSIREWNWMRQKCGMDAEEWEELDKHPIDGKEVPDENSS